jgi:hypothetical protein
VDCVEWQQAGPTGEVKVPYDFIVPLMKRLGED